MSSLSFENIDRWLFEYTEGNLTPDQVNQLEQFIAHHPELQLELDAWNAAKISSGAEVAVDVAAFQKSRRVLPIMYTLCIAALTTTAFFLWLDGDATVQYTQVNIDAQIIDAAADEFSFETNASEVSVSTSATTTNANNTAEDLMTIERQQLQGLSVAANPIPANSGNNVVPVAKKSEWLNSAATNIAKNNSSLNSFVQATANTTGAMVSPNSLLKDKTEDAVEAPELPRVRASLLEESSSYALAMNSEASQSSSKSKSALSKKAKSMLRKVRRMMDQPIALRNFKDPHYAIPNLSSFQANFGMAGTMVQHRFQGTSRNQWVGRNQQQLMNRMAWDGYIRPLRGGVGVDLTYNDYQAGSIRDMAFGLTYSPKFSVSRNVSFEPAMRFKMGVTDVNLNSSIIGSTIEMNRRNSVSMFENGQTPLGSQLWYRDLGVGALVNTKWFYAGVNLDNLGRHYSNFYSSDLTQDYRSALDFSAVFGTEYKSLNKNVTLSTYAYYQNFDEVDEVWGGANVRWKNFQVGAAVSNKLDLGATGGIVFDRFTVHYNIDYLESVVLNERMISHQVTMRMLLKPSRMTMKFLNM